MNSLKSPRPRKLKGFTLLELLIVMTIIGTLAAIIIPNTMQQIRDSKIESANTSAKEIFTAVQNYLTKAQIERVPLVSGNAADKPALPAKNSLPTMTAKHNRQAFLFYGKGCADYSTATTKAKAGSGNVWAVATSTAGSAQGSYHTGNDFVNDGAGLCDRFISGVTDYLGASLNADTAGAFYVIIDTDTYSVVSVYYSDTETGLNDVKTIGNSMFMQDRPYYYSQVFGKTGDADLRSQQLDTNDALGGNDGSYAYVGQYPIAKSKK